LRSRSAPPTPREPGAILPAAIAERAAESPAAINHAADGSDALTQPLPVVIIERNTPSPTPSLTPTVPDDPVADMKKPAPVHAPPLGLAASLGNVSRSVSPAPSLEAILLERKRRLGAAGTAPGTIGSPAMSTASVNVPSVVVGAGGGPAGSAARLVPATVKGARFKSSPLGGGERIGVVVAEQVKEQMEGGGELEVSDPETMLGVEEGRIPGERDKEGPDKLD
jgi:metal transporter CNNM